MLNTFAILKDILFIDLISRLGHRFFTSVVLSMLDN